MQDRIKIGGRTMTTRDHRTQISTTTPAIEAWLTEQVRQLSVDVLFIGVATCTACGEIEGDYIIEFKGEQLRYPLHTAYAVLRFLLESTNP
jgi:hypothetical protein